MKRDFDIIRDLLLTIESRNREEIYKLEDQEKLYNLRLLAKAGYIEAEVGKYVGGIYGVDSLEGITWEGYELLDTIRDETIWKRTRDATAKGSKSVALSVLKEVASKIAAEIALKAMRIS